MEQYSLLVVALSQDGAEQVRDDMAASVVTILSSCSLPTGMAVVYKDLIAVSFVNRHICKPNY